VKLGKENQKKKMDKRGGCRVGVGSRERNRKEKKRQKHLQKTYPFTVYKGYNSHYVVHNKNYCRNETKRQKHQSNPSTVSLQGEEFEGQKGISTSNIRQ
jgi:hypothetical protein